jgi:WD40 repeat protein
MAAGKVIGRLQGAASFASSTWHPSGELLAAATDAAHIGIWDVPRRRLNWKLEHRGEGIWGVFNRGGDLLLSNGWAGRLKLWNPYTGREVLSAAGAMWERTHFDESRLVAVLHEWWKDGAGPLTRVEPGRAYRTLVAGASIGGARDYKECSLHPAGRLLAVGTNQGVGLLDLASGSERAFLPGATWCVLFEPGGSLLTSGASGLLRWPVRANPQAPRHLRVGPPERIPVKLPVGCNVARSADGKILAACNSAGAYVWQRDRPHEAIHLKPHADCRTIAVSPNGEWVATGSHSGTGLKVWRSRDGKLEHEFLTDTIWTMPYFSADGRWLFNRFGQRWRVGDGTEGPRLPGTGGHVAFTADMRLAAFGWSKGHVPLVDPESGRELARLEDPSDDALHTVAFNGDGSLLFGASNDSFCVRVWDLRKIREGLTELDLDWDARPYPPARAPVADGQYIEPLQVEIVGAEGQVKP